MLKPKKPLPNRIRMDSQPDVLPLEVEQLLDVFARIEARRRLQQRTSEKEFNHATTKISS